MSKLAHNPIKMLVKNVCQTKKVYRFSPASGCRFWPRTLKRAGQGLAVPLEDGGPKLLDAITQDLV